MKGDLRHSTMEVEALLRQHPSVADAVVAIRSSAASPSRTVAYVVLSQSMEGGTEELEAEIVDGWRSTYDAIYEDAPTPEWDQDFRGWTSSYDGSPLDASQLQEWRLTTINNILALSPRRILEMGVGTGLLLSQLAPYCDTYWGTDISEAAVRTLRDRLNKHGESDNSIHLRHQSASDIDGLPQQYFDIVILNSVVQYFPSAAYLFKVVRHAFDLVAPGGVVFIGDVRHLSLLRCFRTAIELRRASPEMPRHKLIQTIDQRILAENELLVKPAFFRGLFAERDDFIGATVQLKRSRLINELTQYRYDVVLHKAPATLLLTKELPHLDWHAHLSDPTFLERHIDSGGTEELVISKIPNRRVRSEYRADEMLRMEKPLHEIWNTLNTRTGIDPEDLVAFGQRRRYEVLTTWSENDPSYFDCIFWKPRNGMRAVTHALDTASGANHNGPCSNQIMADSQRRAIVKSLSSFLAESLDSSQMPEAIVVVADVPRTIEGGVAYHLLPSA